MKTRIIQLIPEHRNGALGISAQQLLQTLQDEGEIGVSTNRNEERNISRILQGLWEDYADDQDYKLCKRHPSQEERDANPLELKGKHNTYFYNWDEHALRPLKDPLTELTPVMAMTFGMLEQYLSEKLPPSARSAIEPYFERSKYLLGTREFKKYDSWRDKIRVINTYPMEDTPNYLADDVELIYEALLNDKPFIANYRSDGWEGERRHFLLPPGALKQRKLYELKEELIELYELYNHSKEFSTEELIADWKYFTDETWEGEPPMPDSAREELKSFIDSKADLIREKIDNFLTQGPLVSDLENETFYPLALVYRDTSIYLIGHHDNHQNDYREVQAYQLQGFNSVRIQDQMAMKFPWDWDNYRGRGIDHFIDSGELGLLTDCDALTGDYMIDLELRIRNRSAHKMQNTKRQQIFHEAEIEYEGEFYRLKATVPNSGMLKWWIRSLGSDVEVIHPLELREQFKKDLQQLSSMYEETDESIDQWHARQRKLLDQEADRRSMYEIWQQKEALRRKHEIDTLIDDHLGDL